MTLGRRRRPRPAAAARGGAAPGGLAGVWQRTWLNLRTGNLGAVPIIVGEIVVVIIFGLTATNFFTAVNFVNLITQTAGTAMLAYGVVFVLLLGEIDLSIGYLAGIGALDRGGAPAAGQRAPAERHPRDADRGRRRARRSAASRARSSRSSAFRRSSSRSPAS